MTNPTETSDENLLRRSASGEEQAFLELYRRRQAGIYRFALHMSGSAAIAEEVTQEVFMAVIRDAKRFDPSRGSASAFLIGVARNHVLKALQRNRAYIGLDDESVEPASEAADVVSTIARAEAVENIRQAVLELPAVYREAVVLCDLQEVSYADAAEALGIPVGTVRSRIARGRAQLAQKLSRPGTEGFDSLRCFA
jgi:RNA polymerase sigma-70 factor (ECF subfamily)